MSHAANDDLVFEPEGDDGDPEGTETWNLLVVDDEEEVHRATRFALGSLVFEGKKIRFIDAYSGAEARDILRKEKDIALALIDVVMENENAGLDLVRYIRTTLHNSATRLILRTGQPGNAPETEIIIENHINDYKSKAELTSTKLLSAVVASFRSYRDIMALEEAKVGLRRITKACAKLFDHHSMFVYADCVVDQIASLFDIPSTGVVLSGATGESYENFSPVISAKSQSDEDKRTLKEIDDNARQVIAKAFQTKVSIFEEGHSAFFVGLEQHNSYVCYFARTIKMKAIEIELFAILLNSITIGFEKVSMIEELEHAAYIDKLTKLKNRSRCIKDVTMHIENKNELHVILLDLNQFSSLNTSLGNHAGNHILTKVASLLSRFENDVISVYRMSGDVFSVVIQSDRLFAERKIAVIIQDLESSIEVNETQLPIKFSFGIAGSHSLCCSSILENAELALAESKRLGRGVYFDDSMGEDINKRLNTLYSFSDAIEKNEFHLYFQPRVSSDDLQLMGLEALIRWNSPEHGNVSPKFFIPIAEQSGHILAIGGWVIEQACKQLAEWKSKGLNPGIVAINISSRQLLAPDFIQQLNSTIKNYAIDPSAIEIDISESVIMEDIDNSIPILKEIRSTGIRVSIDDFGTGYSSLSYLAKLPFDVLKIDRSLISDVDRHGELKKLCGMIIDMGHSLSKIVVAEGVETDKELAIMQELGVQEIQGYLVSRPLGPEDTTRFIQHR